MNNSQQFGDIFEADSALATLKVIVVGRGLQSSLIAWKIQRTEHLQDEAWR